MADNVRAPASTDWAAGTADSIERFVGTVRSKTTDPLVGVARWLVYGLLAAIVGTAALILLAVGALRGLIVGLDRVFDDHQRSVWVAEAILGGIFTLGGLFLWSRRRPRGAGS